MNDLQVITREQARASNLTKFFVAEKCKRGHVAPQYVVNRKCVECQRLEMRDRYWENPALRIEKVKEWTKANREKRRLYSREYKKTKPSTFFTHRKREAEAGRPRPEVCELCLKPNTIKKPIYWDHCHKSKKFRGWICHSCNSILGRIKDDANLLRKMADYVERGGIE